MLPTRKLPSLSDQQCLLLRILVHGAHSSLIGGVKRGKDPPLRVQILPQLLECSSALIAHSFMDPRKMLGYISLGKLTEGVPPVPFYEHQHPHWVQIFQCGYLESHMLLLVTFHPCFVSLINSLVPQSERQLGFGALGAGNRHHFHFPMEGILTKEPPGNNYMGFSCAVLSCILLEF